MLKLLRYDPSKLFSSYAIYCNTSRDWKCTSSYITIQFCSLADVSLPNLTFHEITVFDWNYIEFWREWRDWFVFWQRTNIRLNLQLSGVRGSYQVSFKRNWISFSSSVSSSRQHAPRVLIIVYRLIVSTWAVIPLFFLEENRSQYF